MAGARKKPRRQEEDLQKVCVEWFDLQFPRYKQRLFHIPNSLAFSSAAGASRGAFIGKLNRLKAMGLRAGVPDLFLAVPNEPFHGLFIEMKSFDGTASFDQRIFMEESREKQYAAYFVRTFEEFTEIIKAYLT